MKQVLAVWKGKKSSSLSAAARRMHQREVRVPERLYTTFPECTHRNTCSHGSIIQLLVDISLPFVIAGLASQDDSDSDDCVPPTRKHRRICNEEALQLSLSSGCYPEYLGIEGPRDRNNPQSSNPLDFLFLLWPESLCDLIVDETNRYGRCKPKWVDVNRDEILTFLGIVTLMGIKKLPRIKHYWSSSLSFCCNNPPLNGYMSHHRFWQVWSNLHVVDNSKLSGSEGLTRKFKPILDILSRTFFLNYSPGQELAVDEAMIKYKGHIRGKVRMSGKPIKEGFKVWCCCCSCCGYLCTFQVYDGKPIDSVSGKPISEKGMVSRVVKDLVGPFEGFNHVVYMDNFFNSGPLVEDLAKNKIYVAGTIRQTSKGFPENLRGLKLSKGSYACEKVGEVCYYVFEDRRTVSFISNVFPESMETSVVRMQLDGTMQFKSIPPLLPAYNRYMGGVDRLNQLRKTYGFDRKSRRYWIRPFFQFFDYAINNAYLLYKHNCKTFKMSPMQLLTFRMELVSLLICRSRHRKRSVVPQSSRYSDGAPSCCSLSRAADVGLSRGRCRHCLDIGRHPVRHTSFACSFCCVRLCKIPCFTDFHKD